MTERIFKPKVAPGDFVRFKYGQALGFPHSVWVVDHLIIDRETIRYSLLEVTTRIGTMAFADEFEECEKPKENLPMN